MWSQERRKNITSWTRQRWKDKYICSELHMIYIIIILYTHIAMVVSYGLYIIRMVFVKTYKGAVLSHCSSHIIL